MYQNMTTACVVLIFFPSKLTWDINMKLAEYIIYYKARVTFHYPGKFLDFGIRSCDSLVEIYIFAQSELELMNFTL